MDVKNFERIATKRKTFTTISYFTLVFLGIMLFPLNTSGYSPLFLSSLVGYFYIGMIFSGLYGGRAARVFTIAFLLNGIGLCGRILLEWGEYSLMRDLTTFNVGLYLISIPSFIVILYLFVERVKKRAYEGSTAS